MASDVQVIGKAEYLDWEKKVIDAFYTPSRVCTDLMPQTGAPAVVTKRKVIVYATGGATAEMVAASSTELPPKRKLTMFHRGSQSLDSVSHGLSGDTFSHPACDVGGLTNYKQLLGKEAENHGEIIKVHTTSQMAHCAKLICKQWAQLAGKEFPDFFEADFKTWLISAVMAFQTDIQLHFVRLPEEHRVMATSEDVRSKTGKYFTRCFGGPAEEFAENYNGSDLYCGVSAAYITPNLNKENLCLEYVPYAKDSD